MDSRAKTERHAGAVGTNPVLRKWLTQAALDVQHAILGRLIHVVDLGAGSGHHLPLWDDCLRKFSPGTLVYGTDLPEVVDRHGALVQKDRLTWGTETGWDKTLVLSSNVVNVQENLRQFKELCNTAHGLGKYWLINYPRTPRKLYAWDHRVLRGKLWDNGWVIQQHYPEKSCPVWLLRSLAGIAGVDNS